MKVSEHLLLYDVKLDFKILTADIVAQRGSTELSLVEMIRKHQLNLKGHSERFHQG